MKLLLYLLLMGGALTLAFAASTSPASPKPSNGTTPTTVKPETLKELMNKLYDFVNRGISLNLTTIWNWESIPRYQKKNLLTTPIKPGDSIWDDQINGQKFTLPNSMVAITEKNKKYDVYVYYTDRDVACMANLSHDTFKLGQSAPMEDIYEQTLKYGKIYAELIYMEEHATFLHYIYLNETQMPAFHSALGKLPNSFNGTAADVAHYTSYQTFIQHFGTHYISRFTFGGVAQLQAWISPKYFAESLKNNVTKLKELLEQKYEHDFDGKGSEPADLVDPKNQNDLGYRFYGGNIALTDPKEWQKTIHTHRTIVRADLSPIDSGFKEKTIDMKNATNIEHFRFEVNRFRNTFEKSKGLISTMFPDPILNHNPDVLINLADDYLRMIPFPDRKYKDGLYDRKVRQIFLDYINYTMSNRDTV